jgi:hypothetical protein
MGQRHGLVLVSGGSREDGCQSKLQSAGDFWPEVLHHKSPERLEKVRPENALGRVFLESLLVLGVAGLIAVAAVFWAPILS